MLSQAAAAAEFPGTVCVKLFALLFIHLLLLLLSSSYSSSSICHKPASSSSSSSASSSSSSFPHSSTYWLPTYSSFYILFFHLLLSPSFLLIFTPPSNALSPTPLLHKTLISTVCLLFSLVDHMQNSCEEEPYI